MGNWGVIDVIAPIGGVIILLITGSGQPCRGPISKTGNGFTKKRKKLCLSDVIGPKYGKFTYMNG